MNFSKLIKKIDYFFIKTAMINVPDAVYNPIRNYVLECLIDLIIKNKHHLSFSLETRKRFIKLNEKINSEEKSPFQIGDEGHFSFPLEIMPYYNSMTEEHFDKYFAKGYKEQGKPIPETIKKFKNLKKVSISVKILENSDKNPTWQGSSSWVTEDDLYLGNITIPIKWKDIYNILNLETSIIHELTHFIQDYISLMINKRLICGLPQTKSKILNINPLGVIQQEKKCKRCKSDISEFDKFCGECGEPSFLNEMYQRYVVDTEDKENYDKSKKISYTQRDIEYYPLVRDAATYEYQWIKNRIPEILDRDLISTFVAESTVDQFKSKVNELKNLNKISEEEANFILNLNDSYFTNYFFVRTKSMNPEKWKAAVKEFYKIISAKT